MRIKKIDILDSIFKYIYGEDIYLLKKEYFLMSRFNIFYKSSIYENLSYILLDLMENNKDYKNKENNKESEKIIYLLNSLDYKKMREYIKKDSFFSM